MAWISKLGICSGDCVGLLDSCWILCNFDHDGKYSHHLDFEERECSPSVGLFVTELQTFVFISVLFRGENVRHQLASSLQNFRVYICAIALPWIIAATLTITVFVNANFNSITRYSVICPIVLFPATPLLVMCVAYYVIWRKQKSPICNHKKCHQRGQISKHIICDYRSFCFHLTSIPDSEPVGIFSNNCKRFSSANSKTHRHQGFTI